MWRGTAFCSMMSNYIQISKARPAAPALIFDRAHHVRCQMDALRASLTALRPKTGRLISADFANGLILHANADCAQLLDNLRNGNTAQLPASKEGDSI
jgi:hypothetical protein